MALSIANWNIAENIVWYVRLADSGIGISAGLYLTQSDAEAQTNPQAAGQSDGYGTGLPVALENDPGAVTPVSFFQPGYDWHLMVSGQSGDTAKIFKVKQFVDMDEIAHPIYRNSSLVGARAAAEINAHTHAQIIRDIVMGTHMPEIEPGQIGRLVSTRRGLDDMGQVHEHRIVGTPDSLVSEIELRKYLELKR